MRSQYLLVIVISIRSSVRGTQGVILTPQISIFEEDSIASFAFEKQFDPISENHDTLTHSHYNEPGETDVNEAFDCEKTLKMKHFFESVYQYVHIN